MVEWLMESVEKYGAEVGVVDDLRRHTWAEVGALAAGVAERVRGMVGEGQGSGRVGVLLPAGAGFLGAFFGVLLAGKAVVPINFLLGAKEIGHVLKDSGVEVVISTGTLVERMAGSLPGAEEIMERGRRGELKLLDISAVVPGVLGKGLARRGDEELAVLMYTSGTSGLPKGVRLTFGNLRSDVDAAIGDAGFERAHVFLGVVPLFHAFGMTAMMLVPVRLGARVVYIGRFSPVACLNAIRAEGVSLMFGVPSMYQAIGRLKDAKREDFAGVYGMFSGGEPLAGAVRELFESRFGVTLYEGYGLTETSPILAQNVPGASRAGSVGKPLTGVEVRIAGEDGSALARGLEGEIQVRGAMVFGGYEGLAEATAAAFTGDGFFRTGDLGHVDGEGFLFITGRLKDLIIVSGEKAHPREIEEVIGRHPAVAEVAVVGRKDESRGEVPVAFVVVKEGAEAPDANAIRTYCREQNLITWKHPREVVIVKSLPRSPTGKVLKRELGKMLG